VVMAAAPQRPEASAAAATGSVRAWLLPALAFALLTLPFHPFWIDPEAARRGLGGALVGAMLLWRRPQGRPPLGPVLVLGWGLVASLAAANSWEAVVRLTWWGAVAGACWWGVGRDPRLLAASLLPAGAAVAAYALAQEAGWVWPFPAGTDLDGASSLGNRNTASQVLALVTFAAVLVSGAAKGSTLRAAAGAAFATILLGAAALAIHPAGTRGAALALGVAVAALAILPARRRYLPGAVLALIGVVGALVPRGAEATFTPRAPAPGAAVVRTAVPTPSTVEVRIGVWRAALALIEESPLIGQGPGQFRTEFPRVRDPHEHDLSSYNRSFRTEVAHAHNDAIELGTETGIAGLLLAAAALLHLGWTARRGPLGSVGTLPVLLALALSATYSALLNAPVALALAALAGACLPTSRQLGTPPDPAVVAAATRARATRAISLAAGMALLVGGACIVIGQTTAAGYPAAIAQGRAPRPSLLARALGFTPWADHLHAALARVTPLHDAPAHALRAHQLAPHHVEHEILLAELALQGGDPRKAAEWLAEAIAQDPTDPEAQFFSAVLHYTTGDAAGAVDVLYNQPHPRLREELADKFEQFADQARGENRTAEALLFRAEAAFVHTLDAIESGQPEAATNQAVRAALETFRQFERQVGTPTDVRPWLLAAWLAFDQGDRELAATLGRRAQAADARLSPRHRDLVARYLTDLGALPEWEFVVPNADAK